MNKAKQTAILVVILLQFMLVLAAPPEISVFKIERVLPNNLQFEWQVSDNTGLKLIEIYQDGKRIYKEELTGTQQTSVHQIVDDEMKHTFDFIVYNKLNMTTTVTKIKSDDINPPTVSCQSKIISSKTNFSFTTNEPALCTRGLSDAVQAKISKEYSTNHAVNLTLNEGLNRIFIKCSDKEDNEMPGFFVVEFTYDTTGPSKVTNIRNDGKRIIWDSATDANGIDYYNIYNPMTNIASTYQTYWDANTDDGMFYIAAVDKAGNEGEKEEFNLKRAELLQPNITLTIEEQKNKTQGKGEIKINLPEMGEQIKIVLIAAGILIVVFIAWKIYEHKTDPHGLRKYIKKRRKMRELEVRKKI